MFKRVLLMVFLIFNAYKLAISYKYSVAIQDEEIFVPCNTSGVYFAERFLDMSGLRFEFLPNGSIHALGSIFATRDLGTEHIGEDKLTIQVFKKDRDGWSPTVYNINRPDVCQAVFSPNELWHKYTRSISKENRKCPFFVGQNFTFDEIADLDVIIPDPKAAGNYMIVIMIYFKGIVEYFCMKIFTEFYRS